MAFSKRLPSPIAYALGLRQNCTETLCKNKVLLNMKDSIFNWKASSAMYAKILIQQE